jgi:hypothetical protein
VPRFFRSFGSKRVKVIRNEGTDSEESLELEAHVQPTKAFFAVDAPVYEGDVLEIPDPRGATTRRVIQRVDVFDQGSREMQHIEAALGTAGAPRAAPIRRLELQGRSWVAGSPGQRAGWVWHFRREEILAKEIRERARRRASRTSGGAAQASGRRLVRSR